MNVVRRGERDERAVAPHDVAGDAGVVGRRGPLQRRPTSRSTFPSVTVGRVGGFCSVGVLRTQLEVEHRVDVVARVLVDLGGEHVVAGVEQVPGIVNSFHVFSAAPLIVPLAYVVAVSVPAGRLLARDLGAVEVHGGTVVALQRER